MGLKDSWTFRRYGRPRLVVLLLVCIVVESCGAGVDSPAATPDPAKSSYELRGKVVDVLGSGQEGDWAAIDEQGRVVGGGTLMLDVRSFKADVSCPQVRVGGPVGIIIADQVPSETGIPSGPTVVEGLRGPMQLDKESLLARTVVLRGRAFRNVGEEDTQCSLDVAMTASFE